MIDIIYLPEQLEGRCSLPDTGTYIETEVAVRNFLRVRTAISYVGRIPELQQVEYLRLE